MATVTQSSNLVVADTTAPIGVVAVDKEITINAAAPVIQTGPITYAVSGGSDTAVDIGSITAATGYFIEIVSNEDPDTGPDLNLSTDTGGSFAGAVFGRVRAGGIYSGYHTVAIYAKSADASATVSANHRAVEDTAA
jgi:hypothetical protein